MMMVYGILMVVVFVGGCFFGAWMSSKKGNIIERRVKVEDYNADDDRDYREEIRKKAEDGKLKREDLIYANADDEAEYREEEKEKNG